MNVNQLKQSRYLSRADVTKPVLMTIREVVQEDVSMESEPEKLRWVMYFTEAVKGLVLNSTNGQIIAQFIGSEETDHWTGHKVVLYDDPSIMFGGRTVGGIRTRQPRNLPATMNAPAATRPLFRQPALPGTPPPPPPPPQQTALPTEFPEADPASEPDPF